MNKRTIEAMRRCDRALAGIVLIAIATAVSGSALAPYTDKMPASPVHDVAEAPSQVNQDKILRASLPLRESESFAAHLQDERRCLAEALYYEARGETQTGQLAIAEVIFARMHSGDYPSTVCGVVYDGASERHACQFSFVCNGDMERPKSSHEWARARMLAARILSGAVQLGGLTDGATSYHAVSVTPEWAGEMERTVQIGNHVFYRRLARGSERT